MADYLIDTDQKIPDWAIRTAFLGEVVTAINLSVKSWFADMGLSTGDFIWDLFLFNRYDEIKALSSVHFSCSVGSGSL